MNEVTASLVQTHRIKGCKSTTKINSKMIHVLHSLSNTYLLSNYYVLGPMLWPWIHLRNKWMQIAAHSF